MGWWSGAGRDYPWSASGAARLAAGPRPARRQARPYPSPFPYAPCGARCCAAATLLALAPPAGAATPERGDFDARARGEQRAGGAALRERLGRFGLVAADPRTGTPRAVARLDGFLTGAGDRPGSEVALGYVRDHAGVFGLDGGDVERLRLVRRVRAGGVEHLTWEQRYRGIPSADTELRAAVTASGRLLSVTGAPAADLAVGSVEPAVSAERAYAAVRGATIAVERRARRRRAGDGVRRRRPRLARALPGRRRHAARLARARAALLDRGL